MVLCEFIGKELQGHEPAQLGVLGLVHHSHAAATELHQDAIVGDRVADHDGDQLPGGVWRVIAPMRSRRVSGPRYTSPHSFAPKSASASSGPSLPRKIAIGSRLVRVALIVTHGVSCSYCFIQRFMAFK